MQTLMRILNALLTIYSLLLFIRILLSWFRGLNLGRPGEILGAITDPYLDFFRRFRFLVIGNIDFSPILGFIVLAILLNITGSLAIQAQIRLASILLIIFVNLWGVVRFLLILYIILAAVRFVMYLARTSSYSPLAVYLDRLLAPLGAFVQRTFFRRKFLAPNWQAGVTLLFLVLVLVVLSFLANLLAGLIVRIPF